MMLISTWDALIGFFESFSIVLIWLVFFPPVLYRRWITAVGAPADAAPAGRARLTAD